MKKANYIILDVETGGLEPSKNPITQIALIAIDQKKLSEINRFETYVKPYDGLVIEQGALQATGLKMSDINNGVAKKEAMLYLIDAFKSTMINNRPENRPIIVGHNVKFDIGFISSLFERCNKNLFDFISETQICTMALSHMRSPDIASLKLGNCCAEVGVELKDAHKAMNDVKATVSLFTRYINFLRESDSNVTISSKDKEVVKSRSKFQF